MRRRDDGIDDLDNPATRAKEHSMSTVFPIRPDASDALVHDAIARAIAKDAAPPIIEVAIEPPDIAIVTLRGEHDLSDTKLLSEGLARAGRHPAVLVDLSACTYIDLAVIGKLIVARNRQRARGGRLELVIPCEATAMQHIAKRTRLGDALPINASRAAGIDSLSR
jgi:anti-anti-sigma regulatory factor